MLKTLEWVNSGVKQYSGIIAIVGLLSGIMYSTGTFQNYILNKKNRNDKEEAEEKIIGTHQQMMDWLLVLRK